MRRARTITAWILLVGAIVAWPISALRWAKGGGSYRGWATARTSSDSLRRLGRWNPAASVNQA
jgi:hypothetical protein